MRKFLLVSFAMILDYVNSAQSFPRSVISDFSGLNAYSTENNDTYSFLTNQAALASIRQSGFSICGVRGYLLTELSRYSAVAAWPTTMGNFGVHLAYSGFELYNESRIGIAYARTLGKGIDIGAQFNYAPVKISGYGKSAAVYAELGMLFQLADKLRAGLQASNPMGGFFGKNKQETIPFVCRMAIGLDASPNFFTGVELEKQEDKPVSVQVSFQYQLLPALQLRAGIRTDNQRGWCAVGILIRNFRMEILADHHPQLGVSSGLQFVYKIGKEKSADHE